MNRCLSLLAAPLATATLLATAPVTSFASEYPTRPITIVVPYTPGTGIDLIARTLSPRLTEALGQPIVVDNKPGASGNIGADAVAKATPDGHTLMITVNTFTITPALYASIPYDPVNDFQPISQLAVGNLALVINPSVLPVSSFEEFVQYVRERPGKLNYASPGNGTPQHLAMEILKDHLDLDVVHVPYKGAAGASADLMGGQVEMMILPVHTALPMVETGKVKMLGVSGVQRSALAPDTPSFAELGLESVDIDMYYWLAAPANTPPAVVERLNKEAATAIARDDVRETLMKQGMIPTTSSPEAISEMIARDVDRWKTFVSDLGIANQ